MRGGSGTRGGGGTGGGRDGGRGQSGADPDETARGQLEKRCGAGEPRWSRPRCRRASGVSGRVLPAPRDASSLPGTFAWCRAERGAQRHPPFPPPGEDLQPTASLRCRRPLCIGGKIPQARFPDADHRRGRNLQQRSIVHASRGVRRAGGAPKPRPLRAGVDRAATPRPDAEALRADAQSEGAQENGRLGGRHNGARRRPVVASPWRRAPRRKRACAAPFRTPPSRARRRGREERTILRARGGRPLVRAPTGAVPPSRPPTAWPRVDGRSQRTPLRGR